MSNYRSRKLLDTFIDAPRCFGCGRMNDGSVVGAHANWSDYGKGMSIKAHDVYVAGLCAGCHRELDQGKSMNKEEKRAFWESAWRKTVLWWFQSGKVRV